MTKVHRLYLVAMIVLCLFSLASCDRVKKQQNTKIENTEDDNTNMQEPQANSSLEEDIEKRIK